MQYPQACLISTYDVNNNSNNNSTLNPFCALGKFRQQLQHKSKTKRWIVQLRIRPVIEAQCTANVSGPLKETESFLLHTVIITTKNKSHLELQLCSKPAVLRAQGHQNKTNMKTVKQNSRKSVTGNKITKIFSFLFYIPI